MSRSERSATVGSAGRMSLTKPTIVPARDNFVRGPIRAGSVRAAWHQLLRSTFIQCSVIVDGASACSSISA